MGDGELTADGDRDTVERGAKRSPRDARIEKLEERNMELRGALEEVRDLLAPYDIRASETDELDQLTIGELLDQASSEMAETAGTDEFDLDELRLLLETDDGLRYTWQMEVDPDD